jgi:hypothetical protein
VTNPAERDTRAAYLSFSSASVIWQPDGCLLRFTELSAFADVELSVRDCGPFQLALPLFKSCVFSPI